MRNAGTTAPVKRVIWWIKRDFRLMDNGALVAALAGAEEVLPLFVFERGLIAQADTSPLHVWAWQQAVHDLRERCRARGGDVLVSRGNLLTILSNIRQEWEFDAIYSHEETGNGWTYARDVQLQQWCQQHGVEWTECHQNGVVRRLRNRDERNALIKARLWEQAPLPVPTDLRFPTYFRALCAGRVIPALSQFYRLEEYPEIQWGRLQLVSETQGNEDLQSFLTERGKWYSGGISSPNRAFTCGSRLSVHLAWGTLSLRTVYAHLRQRVACVKVALEDDERKRWLRSMRGFESRLHWHCHFIQRLESSPEMEFRPLNPAYAVIDYENDPALLRAWEQGRTGFPIIDACMRCLNATGFMNFRMRAMLVSFACYGLHLDWRVIHPHLARVFLDYEPGIHLSQLQMQAGIVGINTIRVYSPTKQLSDQDPDCRFVKTWLPELRPYTSDQILAYETQILKGYAPPVVDFKSRTKAMKDQIYAVRKSATGRAASAQVLRKHGSRKRSHTRGKKPTPPTEPQSQPDQMELF